MQRVFILLIGIGLWATAWSQPGVDSFAVFKQPLPGSALSFTMVPIPGGYFTLGSPASEPNRDGDESPQRMLKIEPFWMGAHEVSRDAFDVFYNDKKVSQNNEFDAVTRPSAQYIDLSFGMGKEGGYPVNSLSQYAALMYCKWLYTNTGIFYRLPTEAEWEYACRAGTTTAYFFGNNAALLGDYAWFKNNSAKKFHKSGEKKPNPWGLYDMLGNVSEWTLDHYYETLYQKLTDSMPGPMVPANATKYPKVLRGGSYAEEGQFLRSANRFRSDPSWNRRDPQIPKSKWWLTDAPFVGFRVVVPAKQPTPEEAVAFYEKYLGK